MTRIKKWMAVAFIAVFMLAMSTALGERARATGEIIAPALPGEAWLPEGGLEDDIAFEGYVRGLFGLKDGSGALFATRNLGGDLTGMAKRMYDGLKAMVIEVAAGERASTVFALPVDTIGADTRYTAEDLGVERILDDSKTINAEAKSALLKKFKGSFEFNPLTRYLLWDCPYELYWYNKTVSTRMAYPTVAALPGATSAEDVIYFKNSVTFSFPVIPAYADGDYTFNTHLAQSAQKASDNAKAVVRRYAQATDFGKLTGYKDAICDYVDYNDEAASSSEYSDAFQLIWVFDGDRTTKVVCEGYAKAFQYLCDMTDFVDDDIYCYCVTGNIVTPSSPNGQGHMWNIVHMPNGLNYHVDVTNCDTFDGGGTTIGAPDKLFLKGYTSGSVDEGYTFALRRNVTYSYKPVTRSIFSDAELTISKLPYLDEMFVPIDRNRFTDTRFRAFVSTNCDANQDGMLSASEIKAVTALDVSGHSITSLEGIGYLVDLKSLNCGGNRFTELNLSENPKLTHLYCTSSKLTSLDISACKGLVSLIASANRQSDGQNRHYKSESAELVCDLGLRMILGSAWQDALVLPEGITEIDDESFTGIAMQAVTLPSGVTRIGTRAFADCPNLMEVVIPNAISSIADDAFENCPDVFIVSPSAAVRRWATAHGIGSAAS